MDAGIKFGNGLLDLWGLVLCLLWTVFIFLHRLAAGDQSHSSWAPWFIEDARSSWFLYHEVDVGSLSKKGWVTAFSHLSYLILRVSLPIHSLLCSVSHKVCRPPRRAQWPFVQLQMCLSSWDLRRNFSFPLHARNFWSRMTPSIHYLQHGILTWLLFPGFAAGLTVIFYLIVTLGEQESSNLNTESLLPVVRQYFILICTAVTFSMC